MTYGSRDMHEKCALGELHKCSYFATMAMHLDLLRASKEHAKTASALQDENEDSRIWLNLQ